MSEVCPGRGHPGSFVAMDSGCGFPSMKLKNMKITWDSCGKNLKKS